MPVRSIEGECQPPLYRAKITAKADIFASSWERGDQAMSLSCKMKLIDTGSPFDLMMRVLTIVPCLICCSPKTSNRSPEYPSNRVV